MRKLLLPLLLCLAIALPGIASPVWNYPLYIKELSSDLNRLVNKTNLLEKKDSPVDLVEVKLRKASGVPIQARQVCADAASKLFAAAEADGITLYLKSGYRSYQTQETMYTNRLEKNNGKDDALVAKPGASEHQSGLALDVVNAYYAKADGMNAGFYDSPEGKWLEANCSRFGFVIRYPQDKEDITEIKYEPWHIRYVGINIAKYMEEHNLCHEEFTQEWQAAFEKYQAQGGTMESAIQDEFQANAPAVSEQTLEDGETEISISFNQ